MSELQLGLLGIGVLVVVGVLVYNKLQEAKLKRQSEEVFGSRHDDVLLGGQRPSGSVDSTAERIEPTMSVAAEETSDDHTLVDSGIDFIASLETPTGVSGEAVSNAIVESTVKPGKTVNWAGYNRQTGSWEPLAAGGEYEKLHAGLQLADRNGAASDQDLADFSALAEGVAAAIGASCTLAETSLALKRAQQLDALCAEVDVQIGLNVIAVGGSIAGTRVRAFAEAQGLALEGDGRFCRRDDAGLELYSLCNMQAPAFSADGMKTLVTKGVTLLFDVARVPGGIVTFDHFIEFARALAESLSARIVDDNQRPLDEAALGRIRTQLAGLYGNMEQQGIPAGGALALRLFA